MPPAPHTTDALRPKTFCKSNRCISGSAKRALRRFLSAFPDGFKDETYFEWERGYKWAAHQAWGVHLKKSAFADLLRTKKFADICALALKIESKTNFLFSFEKMALCDALKDKSGCRTFAEGLYAFLYTRRSASRAFNDWCEVIAALPRKQTRVLTWPIITVFGFIAHPEKHIFLKPQVTRTAALAYGFPLLYCSKPNFETYTSMLNFAQLLQYDLNDLKPRDMIDIQSFIWVQGSAEYA